MSDGTMRIGFTGAGGTGKTSALSTLQYNLPMGTTFPVLPSASRSVLAEFGTTDQETRDPDREWALQFAMFERRLRLEGENPSFVSDRTMLDHYAYILARCHGDPRLTYSKVEEIEGQVYDSMMRLDKIYYFPIYWQTPDDSVRSVNAGYQRVLDAVILSFLIRKRLQFCYMANEDVERRARFVFLSSYSLIYGLRGNK